MSFIVVQLGAREHYLTARGLFHRNLLKALLTDTWIPPTSTLGLLSFKALQQLKERYHPDLAAASVCHSSLSALGFEMRARLGQANGWNRMIRRNAWFQKRVLATVERLRLFEPDGDNVPPAVFSYSYAARRVFQAAKSSGCFTILGQIDAGPFEDDLVRKQHAKYPEFGSMHDGPPSSYWESWFRECELADLIVVNSPWSRQALLKSGIDGDKVCVVPLGYETDNRLQRVDRNYPEGFSGTRPLRVLFLGVLTLRKGVAQLMEAASGLTEAPVEFWIVGGGNLKIPDRLRNLKNVRWIGHVARGDAVNFFRSADVFILPTISDGFALTQLEAQAQGLPVIASPFCGEVVKHGRNGLLMKAVTKEEIIRAIDWCLSNPRGLESMAAEAVKAIVGFHPDRVLEKFLRCVSARNRAAHGTSARRSL